MRAVSFLLISIAAGALTACTLFQAGPRSVETSAILRPADAATNLIAGGNVSVVTSTAPPSVQGADPLVRLRLLRADGRALAFTAANHAPNDLMAQAAGGPLAQAMGFFGDEAPSLFHADPGQSNPFLCSPSGPAALGVYEDANGGVSIAALTAGFEFETLADGSTAALPYSPNQVCARLKFTKAG